MVNIIISADPRYKVNRDLIKEAVMMVLQQNKVSGWVEIGVNIVGDRKIHELNKKYRGLDKPTNILTFALEDVVASNLQQIPRVGFVAAPDKILRLGDICISHPQAVEDAVSEGTSVDEEIRFLIEHGTKHLLGLHHD